MSVVYYYIVLCLVDETCCVCSRLTRDFHECAMSAVPTPLEIIMQPGLYIAYKLYTII